MNFFYLLIGFSLLNISCAQTKTRGVAYTGETTTTGGSTDSEPNTISASPSSTASIASKSNPRLVWDSHVNCHWIVNVEGDGGISGNTGTIPVELKLANSQDYENYKVLAHGKAVLRVDQHAAKARGKSGESKVEIEVSIFDRKEPSMSTSYKIFDGGTALRERNHNDSRIFSSYRGGSQVESLKTGVIDSSTRGKRQHDVSVTCNLEKLKNR